MPGWTSNRKPRTLLYIFLLASMTMLTSCGGSGSGPVDGNELAGTVMAVGSTALQPLVERAAHQFKAINPRVRIQVQGGGSGTGLTQVAQGSVDIGNSDIYAQEKTGINAGALVDYKVCVIGFAIVANPGVSVDNLSQQQVIDIFTGRVTNWIEVGGENKPIVVINRAKSSGTRATFKKYALNDASEAENRALSQDSTGAVKKTVAELDGAISYLALPYTDKTVKLLKFNGIAPTPGNIASGIYPIWSYEHMYTGVDPSLTTRAFIDYMLGEEVQQGLVKEMGFVPIGEMKVSR